MLNIFLNLNYIEKSLLATLFTFVITVLGSSIIFFFKNIKKDIANIMLSISAGIMLSASYFSLLAPAISSSINMSLNTPLIITSGFISGGIILFISDKILNKLITKKKKKIILLFSSITIHNIPEGLAIGIAFGSIYYGISNVTNLSALILTLGIAIQNFPEGASVSIPLIHEGLSKKKSFILGSMSAIVEPIFGVLGALLVLKIKYLLPFFLSFASGAMIYVITSELIPESQNNEKKDLMTLFTILGFTIMMILELIFN